MPYDTRDLYIRLTFSLWTRQVFLETCVLFKKNIYGKLKKRYKNSLIRLFFLNKQL